MQLRWSSRAVDDLEHVAGYIARDSPGAAQRVALLIYEGIDRLREFPHSGRPGRVEGTRELVYPSLPFVAVYRVTEDAIEIARILHARQRWPE